MILVFRFCAIVCAILTLSGCSSSVLQSNDEDWRVAAQRPEMNQPIDPEHFDPQRVARAIFEETNVVRRELHLPPFRRLNRLDEAADIQASANALGANAAHSNIINAWATPTDRVRSVGLTPRLVSENVALLPLYAIDPSHGYYERNSDVGHVVFDGQTGLPIGPHTYVSFAQAIVKAWMNSPGHRANIVNPIYRYLGCSARPTRSVTRLQILSGAQVFFTPPGE